ncbi:MAG: 50S ribosomal protein L24 [Verrucomicrobiota bacterium]|nr:50S ribosomal protein L24 [Opitutales bacterium]UPA28701.1 MAG: 50S ribosomal protein L24 [Verrucomicrobiota bacterium]
MKYKLKRNDEVVVISGQHKGERGKVLEVLREACRVVVEGVALRKHYLKKDQNHPEGGEVERESSLHYSNVMLASRYDRKRK